jgi:hypothetical protein
MIFIKNSNNDKFYLVYADGDKVLLQNTLTSKIEEFKDQDFSQEFSKFN